MTASNPAEKPDGGELHLWRESRRLDPMLLRYGVLMLAVVLVLSGSLYWLGSLEARGRKVDGIRLDVRRMLRLQIDEESAIRGYAATREQLFLEPFYDAVKAFPPQQSALARELSADPEQAAALGRFAALHAAWQRDVAAPIIRAPADPANKTREFTGKVLVDDMRGTLSQIDAYYLQASAAVAATSRLILDTAAAVVVLLILTIAIVAFVTERRRARREEALLLSVMRARDSAARLSDWRSKVIAMLAHDFRATLAVVAAYVEMLEDFPERRLDPQSYDRIKGAIGRLAAMADEALLMARITHGNLALKPEPILVNEVVSEVADQYRAGREIRVQGDDQRVLGDRSYLLRVFDNLVSNAVKYSPKSAPIEALIQTDGDEVVVAVADAGDGIAPEDLPHVFEEFWRSSDAAKRSGSGVGLFIAKKIVDAHGGTIAVRSRPRSGATVSVRLPVARD
jgi:signal transduction histidine kinase